jgi:hypothetical protein
LFLIAHHVILFWLGALCLSSCIPPSPTAVNVLGPTWFTVTCAIFVIASVSTFMWLFSTEQTRRHVDFVAWFARLQSVRWADLSPRCLFLLSSPHPRFLEHYPQSIMALPPVAFLSVS